MKGLVTVSTLHSRALSLATIARELLIVHQVIQRFANVDPLFGFNIEPRILIILNTVLVKEERLPDQLSLIASVLILTERAYKWLICFLAKTALLYAS